MAKANENQYSVGMMCRLMAVSRSGYHGWRHRPLSGRGQANQLLTDDIKRVFEDEKGQSGSPAGCGAKGCWQAGTAWPGSCVTTAWARKRPGNTRRPRTANTHCRLPPTCWNRILRQASPTKSGCRTSPISGRTKAGCA